MDYGVSLCDSLYTTTLIAHRCVCVCVVFRGGQTTNGDSSSWSDDVKQVPHADGGSEETSLKRKVNLTLAG